MKGYFRKRGNKWSFTIDIGKDPKTGRRKQKSKSGFKTKKEAQNACAELIAELNQGTYVEEQNITFEKFSKQWLKLYEEMNDIKPNTLRLRKREVNIWLQYFSKVPMKDITRSQYQQVLDELKKKYAHNTLKGIHLTGKMIFKKAIQLEVIKKNPTEFTYLKRTKKSLEELEAERIPKYLEKEELAHFLKTAEKEGLILDNVIFPTLAYTGMRVGELLSLKWSDVDFDEKTIHITKTIFNPTNNTKKYELTPTKTGKGRMVVVDDYVINRLRRHLAQQNEMKMLYRNQYHDQNFIFAKYEPNPGYPLFVKSVEYRMKRLLKIAGLSEQLTPHSLRHTHTSLLAEAGVGLEFIMERLGHIDDNTTRNIYLHVTKTAKKEASQKFSELMRNFIM